jgi:YD repeat-containing protein
LNAFATTFNYDGNGNILELRRSGNLGGGAANPDMDHLSYTYPNGTNLLTQVSDAISSTPQYDKDIEGTTTYAYDDSGNLISENGTNAIDWNVYGKVDRVHFPNIRTTTFTYGPDQSRWIKERLPLGVVEEDP